MIPFNQPCCVGNELKNVVEAIEKNRYLSGDGPFTVACKQLLENRYGVSGALLTTSCTHALEMTALLANIEEGDEVIAPSYTFVSTVNAFALRGAKIVFVDIRPDTMNLDETLIEGAITPKTKAIIPVHYAGVACEMDTIMAIAKKHNLIVVEDAAQGVHAYYKGSPLGTIGDFGCYSFHETKNYSCGEGGALLIKSPEAMERAEIIREKGTNRKKYLRHQVDKYSWVDLGSSYLPSELNAAYLYGQLEQVEKIYQTRMAIWNAYNVGLTPLALEKKIVLPTVPPECRHNGHMFYVKTKDLEERNQLTDWLKDCGITAYFHYIPLHSSEAGLKYGRMHGEDRYTTLESERLLRLPLFYELDLDSVEYIIQSIRSFYEKPRL